MPQSLKFVIAIEGVRKDSIRTWQDFDSKVFYNPDFEKVIDEEYITLYRNKKPGHEQDKRIVFIMDRDGRIGDIYTPDDPASFL